MKKKVAAVGLGLMGGSMAMAIRKYTDCRGLRLEPYPFGCRTGGGGRHAARHRGRSDPCRRPDYIIISLYPQSTVDFLLEHMPRFKKGCIIVDLVGVKRFLQENLEQAAIDAGVHFIGGHPMAGKEFSGYAFATPELFQNASMILVPNASSPLWAVDEMDGFFGAWL